jgi:hypothetical protein
MADRNFKMPCIQFKHERFPRSNPHAAPAGYETGEVLKLHGDGTTLTAT